MEPVIIVISLRQVQNGIIFYLKVDKSKLIGVRRLVFGSRRVDRMEGRET